MNAPVDRYQPGAPLPDLRDGARLLVLLAGDGGHEEAAARSAISLAKQWADSGQRIFLADLALRSPRLHELLGEPCGEGVADALLYGASIQRIARPTHDGFLFASAGTPVASGDGVFASPFWDVITEGFARADARLVVFLPADEPGADELVARAGQVVRLVAEVPAEVAEAAVEIADAEPPAEVLEAVSDVATEEPPVLEEPVVEAPVARSRRLGADAVPIESLAPDWVPIESLAPDPAPVAVEPALEPLAVEPSAAIEPVGDLAAEAVFEPFEEPAAEEPVAELTPSEEEVVPIESLAPDVLASVDPAIVEVAPAEVIQATSEPSASEPAEEETPSFDLAAAAASVGPAEEPGVADPPSFDLESWEAASPSLPSFDLDMSAATPSEAATGSLTDDSHQSPSFGLGAFEPELEPETPDPARAITRELTVAEILSPAVEAEPEPPRPAPVRELSSFSVSQESVTPERVTREAPSGPRPPRGITREPEVELHGSRWLRLVILVIVIGVVVAGILAYMGILNVPGISPASGTVASALPEPRSLPAAPVQERLVPEVVPPSYFIALGDYPQEAVARLQAESLGGRRPDILFLVAPVEQQGRVLFRLLAGVSDDPAAAALRSSLGQTLVDEDPSTWPVRLAPLAFFVGGFASAAQARVRVQELQDAGVPAYVLEDGNDQPFLVWVGAYADAGEASYVKSILDRARIVAALKARTGALPEMGLPR